MKLCKNCHHFSRFSARCHRSLIKKFDPVHGETTEIIRLDADAERRPIGWLSGSERCGPNARYFEQRTEPHPPPPDGEDD